MPWSRRTRAPPGQPLRGAKVRFEELLQARSAAVAFTLFVSPPSMGCRFGRVSI